MSPPSLQKHNLAGKRIIVSGAGLSGLAFVCAFERYWPQDHPKPELVIYERSSAVLDRAREGYTMNIKPESGLHALEELGLLKAALNSSTVGTNGIQPLPTFWTKEWKPMLDLNTPEKLKQASQGKGNTTIRLVRHVLRDTLLDSVPAHIRIHWERGCSSAQVLEGGRMRIDLNDGSSDECDLLIAADGANSKIRSVLLPEEILNYTGANCIMGTSRFPSGKPGILREKWGMSISGCGVPFLTFPIDQTTGVWALTYRAGQPRERIRGDEAVGHKDEILAEVRERGNMLHEPFNQFVEATDPLTLQVFSAMHKYPINHTQKLPHANVILIGDANHPMSPFSGNGANMALLDAVVLAQQLSTCSSLRTAVETFDEERVSSSGFCDAFWFL
ncbi:hypothetical protein BKA63DRAFT_574727 [Paraphoma chrysanthemicola]|nr:hypothetical protein BKA63DRAFT_574727 [Paraphoma chrysanthemicola]